MIRALCFDRWNAKDDTLIGFCGSKEENHQCCSNDTIIVGEDESIPSSKLGSRNGQLSDTQESGTRTDGERAVSVVLFQASSTPAHADNY